MILNAVRAWRGVAVVALALLGAEVARAQAPNPITLYLGQATGNKGDTALVSVELGVGNTRPTNLVVWLRYNPAKIQPDVNAFEFTVLDLDGNPIRDSNNNVITSHGAVRREQVLLDAGKVVDSEVHSEGAIGIAVQGLNNQTIAPGAMLTVAFKVQNGVAENEVIPVEGAEIADPVQFMNNGSLQTAYSSANYQLPNDALGDLPVEISDGRVTVPCTPLAAPTGVTATQGQPDAVVVSWTGVVTAGAQYRVYRSKTSVIGDAQPLSTGPQAATTFMDVTAEAPTTSAGGCACNQTASVVHYFYWVRSVSQAGCESEFSTPAADGYRGTAKAASALAKTVVDTLPSKAAGVSANAANAGQAVAVRLENVVPGTVWAEASGGAWQSSASRFVLDGASAGWASVDLPATLEAGTRVLLTAGATSSDGSAVGPVVREFVVGAATAKSLLVSDLGVDAFPYLPEGVGSVYQIAPEGLYGKPTTVYLPVPEGEDASQLLVYTYIAAQGDRRWYLGANIAGWLAGPPVVELLNGQPHVRISVRYGAVVQLGHAPSASVTKEASIAPIDLARMHSGDLLLIAALAGIFAIARARARRA